MKSLDSPGPFGMRVEGMTCDNVSVFCGQSAPVEAALAAVIGLGGAFNSELINLIPRTLAGTSGTTCLTSTGATELG